MKKEAITGILVMLILFAGLIGMVGTPVVAESIPPLIEEPQPPPGDLWMPYVPHPNLVDLELLTVDQWVSVEVTLWLTGCAVSDWGTLEQDGNNFWVDTQIWKWMGPVPQIVIPESYIYDLGYLEAGNYTFTFKAWGIDVKSVSFTATTAQMLLETDKDVYILGENVKIMLKNIGTETESIGGYPAWGIYEIVDVGGSPWEFFVYPEYYMWLAWSLEPEENDTYTFGSGDIGAGMYVVRDTQGWNLSAYFAIIVGNLSPTANFIYSPTFPYVGQAVTFDASGSSDVDGTIVSHAWDFGDGFIETDVVTTHNYESAGTFTVTLTVTDDLGAIDTFQQEITVDPFPTLTITVNKIKTGSTETILLELMDDDYDGFITQDINNSLLALIKRTHKTTTFDFPGEYTGTKGAWKVTLQSRNDFTVTLT